MIKPIRNTILFKPFLGDEISEGGIIVPDNVRGESDKGIIVKVGNGTKIRPMLLKAGEIGHRVHLWGEEIMVNGEKFYLMEDSAIIAIEDIEFEYNYGDVIKMGVKDRIIKLN